MVKRKRFGVKVLDYSVKNMEKKRVRVHVEGRVQGVFYRENTRRFAASVGAVGWVRNLPDGRVEALVQGTPEQVEMLLEYMKTGPSHARVDSLSSFDEQPSDEFDSFTVMR